MHRCKNAFCVNGPFNMLGHRHAHACNMSTLHKHANTAGKSCVERWTTWREMKHKTNKDEEMSHLPHQETK